MSDVRDSMRDYINVIANPAEAGDSIPASSESQSVEQVSHNSMCEPSEREVHGISHDPEQNAPLTAMNTPGATLVGRIGELARALQAVFDSEDTPDSYYPDDMHDSEDAESNDTEETPGEESDERNTDYEQSQEDSDSRELLNDDDDEDKELDEAAPAETAGMAPKVDQAGHRSYADGQGSSFAARKGMTG